jgi:hydroxyacylglutathione hydrolase
MPGTQDWRFRPLSHPAIHPVAAFEDNYIWLLVDAQQHRAAVVDPGDAAPVIAALRERGLALAAVLVTHHHRDHVGGLAALRSAFPQAVVYGPHNPAIAGIDRRLRQGDTFRLDGFDAEFTVHEVPGHTLDHIAFFSRRIGHDPRPVLFCGDTLFAAGCGRLFEGSASQMMQSLGVLASLPDETLVHCAHEYTLSNLRFARAAEPDNAALADREREAIALRAASIETVPSSIAIERATNPFLRWREPGVRATAAARAGMAASANTAGTSATDNGREASTSVLTDEATFATIRQWKNDFRA